ncbi:hypothetical protein ACQVTS_32060 [Bacillus mycoides]|uniref:hypothetical protein n=1 Tax=Bacillus mycoides TaxID=1405 RepID=UPI003D661517
MTKSVVVVPKASEFGMTSVKAKQIEAQFKPMLKQMTTLEEEANVVFSRYEEDPTNPLLAGEAKEVRLKLVKCRTGTATIHKEQKAFYRAAGLFIDGFKNAQLFAGQGLEEQLMGIEKAEERRVAAEIKALEEERVALLEPYEVSNVESLSLGTMDQNVFEHFLDGVKTSHAKKIEAEKKEAKRIEEEKRKNELFRKRRFELAEYSLVYNERVEGFVALTAESTEEEFQAMLKAAKEAKVAAEKKQKELEEENARIKKEREKVEKLRKKREAEAKKKLEAEEKKRKEAEAKLKKQEEEKKLREKKEQEEKDRLERIKAEKAKAPDIEKMSIFAQSILDIEKPSVSDPELMKVLNDAVGLLQKVNVFIKEKI